MSLENLINQRDALLKTVSNLEMGLHQEKKKALEYDFFRNDSNYNQSAMDDQVIRSKENIKNIEKILREEKNKLQQLEKEISQQSNIVNKHGIFPCLLGTIPHTWQILAKHLSGKFSHRVCTVCKTQEKVGYS